MTSTSGAPELFTQAVAALKGLRPRPELQLGVDRAPQRLAPWAYAFTAEINGPADELATGRLILLHDPAGHDAWNGTMRLVTYVTAELEPELAADPLLPAVGWSWLIDGLEASGAVYTAIGGTVTQTLSTRFGELAGPPTAADIEIRASWTPLDDDLGAHVEAWCALLASTAGLPPPGVTAIRQ